ncbi:glycogen phosphorylase [Holotrichia oblita]|nr:glycogen phosphorylase [Holotrichia oblita]
MKFMMNGGITLGTLDGANVEILDMVGEENVLIFGMNAKEVERTYNEGVYDPKHYYYNDSRLHLVIDQLTNGFFDKVPALEFLDIQNNLLFRDNYFILKDFDAYCAAHEKANELYKNRQKWLSMSILNTARSYFFTTDRTMEEYNKDIWHLDKIKVNWTKR